MNKSFLISFCCCCCCCCFLFLLGEGGLHSFNLNGHIRAERNNGIKFVDVTSELMVILLSFISMANKKKEKKKKKKK